MEELKPCPFCGAIPKVNTYESESLWSHDIVDWYYVGCFDCGITFDSEIKEDSIKAWNTRQKQAKGIIQP